MRLLVWRVVKKTLKFCLTFLILLTINFLLTVTFQKTPLCCLWRIVESHHLVVKKLGFISISQVTHLELLNFPFLFFSFFFFFPFERCCMHTIIVLSSTSEAFAALFKQSFEGWFTFFDNQTPLSQTPYVAFMTGN